MLSDPLLQLNDQHGRLRLERFNDGELRRGVRHVLSVLARRDYRIVLVSERRERGGFGETMLCDGKLDDRAILGRRREREPDLLGGDLHRIQRVIGDRTRTDERGAGTDGDDDEADAERAHRVRRRLAENFE